MKLRAVLILYLMAAIPLAAQELGNLDFINNLGEKDAATYGDAVTFFIYMQNRYPEGFEADIKTLNRSNITTGIKAGREDVLTRGTLSLMLARYLNLKDSLLYLISNTGRYAYRACVAADLMDFNGSEWDIISGEELIEIMAIASEKGGKKK
jgi:hypothetical protein